MNLTVLRDTFDDVSTQGEMLLNGQHFAYTLEPRKDQSRGKPFCIPAGTYNISLGWSEHFSMVVPQIINVPGFTGVEIHPGNFPSDTHGCCLVGETKSNDFIGNSRAEFELLMNKLNGTTGNTIQYVG